MKNNKPGIGIGISDFRDFCVDRKLLFVDKSALIQEVLQDESAVLLITRPRRFGKTLNMSMLRYFFDCRNQDQNRELFRGLQIFEDEEVMQHQGERPVIFLSFKECKDTKWERTLEMFQSMISSVVREVLPLLKESGRGSTEYQSIMRLREKKASFIELTESLALLSQLLCGSEEDRPKPLILIDEYDVPLRSAWSNGYWDEAVNFLGKFFSSALKDCQYVWKGIMTGCMRISKESIFTDLNNLSVHGVSSKHYASYFGFTSKEVDSLLSLYGLEQHRQQVEQWYNGYNFGGITIYNPWSILNWLKDDGEACHAYWVNTSGNELVRSMLRKADSRQKGQLELLMKGESIKVPLQEHLVYTDLDTKPDCIWNFLYVTGYLKCDRMEQDGIRWFVHLSIPNLELETVFAESVSDWFLEATNEIMLSTLGDDLRQGRTEDFEVNFKYLVQKSFSYFDLGTGEPENFYHAFILGLLVNFQSVWDIRSNREAGYGRADLLMSPKDPQKDYAVVIEFKADRGEDTDLKGLSQIAYDQIEKRQYEQELRNQGAEKIVKAGIAFEGKKVEMVIVCC